MSDIATKKRTRGGGGAARRASRTSINFETEKFIERKIPLFEILNDEALEIIESNAELMLEEVGVSFVNNLKFKEINDLKNYKISSFRTFEDNVLEIRNLTNKDITCSQVL